MAAQAEMPASWWSQEGQTGVWRSGDTPEGWRLRAIQTSYGPKKVYTLDVMMTEKARQNYIFECGVYHSYDSDTATPDGHISDVKAVVAKAAEYLFYYIVKNINTGEEPMPIACRADAANSLMRAAGITVKYSASLESAATLAAEYTKKAAILLQAASAYCEQSLYGGLGSWVEGTYKERPFRLRTPWNPDGMYSTGGTQCMAYTNAMIGTIGDGISLKAEES